jgi:hypothetical protein
MYFLVALLNNNSNAVLPELHLMVRYFKLAVLQDKFIRNTTLILYLYRGSSRIERKKI